MATRLRLDELYGKYIPELWKVGSDFRSAVKLYQVAELRGDLQLKDYILRWFLGERINAIDLRWINRQLGNVRINNNIGDDNAFLMLKNISQVSKIMGFNGLVILLDEAESIPSIYRVADGYINLIKLIMQSINLSGVFIIYATTQQFYDDAKIYFKSFESEETKDFLDLVYKRMEKERLKLIPLSPDEKESIAKRIIDIYMVSNGEEGGFISSHRSGDLPEKIKDICLDNQTMRDFIEKIILTIKEGELSQPRIVD